jgi:replicative DNA helicase
MNNSTQDYELESAVLSCVFLSQAYMPRLLDIGLRAEHFYDDELRKCYAAMMTLFDEAGQIDELTVSRKANVPLELCRSLASSAPAASSARTYAKNVIELAERRRLVEAGELMKQAGITNNLELREDAERLLSVQGHAGRRTFTPDQLASKFWDRLDRGSAKSWPLPSERLTSLIGGLRPGEVTLIGGWTSHGKSVLLDDILRFVSSQAETHLFINEMTADERTDRFVAAQTGVPALKVAHRDRLSPEQLQKVINAIGEFPYGITEAAGWSAQDLRREIRRRDYDVVGVDILHLIEYREERDLASISRTLNIAAKESNCHILATVHLKDERLKTAIPPPPTLSDIKGAGALKQDADNVLFVYRECDDIGSPGEDSKIWLAKARQGQTGGIRADFVGSKMTFVERFMEPV